MKLNITMMPNPTAFKHSSPHRAASHSHLGEHRVQLVCGVRVLERDADALVGVLLEGGSVPWTEAIQSLS